MSEPTRPNSQSGVSAVKFLFFVEEMLLIVACIFYKRTNSVLSTWRQFKLICPARRKFLKHVVSMTL